MVNYFLSNFPSTNLPHYLAMLGYGLCNVKLKLVQGYAWVQLNHQLLAAATAISTNIYSPWL